MGVLRACADRCHARGANARNAAGRTRGALQELIGLARSVIPSGIEPEDNHGSKRRHDEVRDLPVNAVQLSRQWLPRRAKKRRRLT